MSVLDNPFWHALGGDLASLSVGNRRAKRFKPEVNVFAALPDAPRPGDWCALADLLGADGRAVVSRAEVDVPLGWQVEFRRPSVQLVAGLDLTPVPAPEGEAEVEDLTSEDGAAMVALADRARPGPFTARTVEQGGFVGIRSSTGKLVAMAGTRCRMAGAVEISSVCTDPDSRGHGHATRLITELGHRIQQSGCQVFLHTAADNVAALALYDRLGFIVRHRPDFVTLRPPRGHVPHDSAA